MSKSARLSNSERLSNSASTCLPPVSAPQRPWSRFAALSFAAASLAASAHAQASVAVPDPRAAVEVATLETVPGVTTVSSPATATSISSSSNSLPSTDLPSTDLPDAPEISLPAAAGTGQGPRALSGNTAGPYDMTIQPGELAPRLSVHQKVVAGIKDSFSPVSMTGWVVSSLYSFATNNSPNYGQTGKGFAQNLGASAARATSENLFTEAVLSPILHEDARYYRMGPGHNFIKRLVYSGTRPIFGRTDGGHQTLNIANLGGNLAGAALTQAYYPQLNRGTTEMLKTFGGSVGGSALGFVVTEFIPHLPFTHNKN